MICGEGVTNPARSVLSGRPSFGRHSVDLHWSAFARAARAADCGELFLHRFLWTGGSRYWVSCIGWHDILSYA
jgi:hypothetical protein